MSFGCATADFDNDGRLDLVVNNGDAPVIGQNDSSPEPQVGRMDGGTSLVLLGKGEGRFEPLTPEVSGVLVPEEVRRLAVTDLDGDGREDLVFRVSPGGFRCFTRLPNSP